MEYIYLGFLRQHRWSLQRLSNKYLAPFESQNPLYTIALYEISSSVSIENSAGRGTTWKVNQTVEDDREAIWDVLDM